MGRPINAEVTSLRASSRSGAADDNFFDLDDGSSVAVGPASTIRLRNNAGVLEASINGAAYIPVISAGGGLELIGEATVPDANQDYLDVVLSETISYPTKLLILANGSIGSNLNHGLTVNQDRTEAHYKNLSGDQCGSGTWMASYECLTRGDLVWMDSNDFMISSQAICRTAIGSIQYALNWVLNHPTSPVAAITHIGIWNRGYGAAYRYTAGTHLMVYKVLE